MCVKRLVHPIPPLLQLVDALPQIDGRKKLQKTVHILKELGVPFYEKFEYSYYGMYSPQLKSEIDILITENLLEENQAAFPTGGTGFRIAAKPDLKQLLHELEETEPAPWIGLARQLNEYSPQILEGISTLFFLQRTGETPGLRLKKLVELKPHLKDLADDCNVKFEELQNLRLA